MRVEFAWALLARTLFGDIVSQIETAIIGFFQGIWNGIQSFFASIFGSFGNLISQAFQAPINSINQSFASLSAFSNSFGPFAPIITIAVVMAFVLVIFFVVWVVIKLTVSEGEQTLGEAEEGA